MTVVWSIQRIAVPDKCVFDTVAHDEVVAAFRLTSKRTAAKRRAVLTITADTPWLAMRSRTACRYLILTALVTHSTSLATVASTADHPSPAEIKALFHQNMQQLGSCRVTFEWFSKAAPGMLRTRSAELELTRNALDKTPEDSPHRRALEKKVADLVKERESLLAAMDVSPASHHRRGDFWTNHRDFQIRMPRSYSGEMHPFPDFAPISPGHLASHFADFSVLSWSPETGARPVVWNGVDPNGGQSYATSSPSIEDFQHFTFPVLGYIRTEWGDRHRWSIIDRFFNHDEADYEFVGMSQPNAQGLYVLEVPESSDVNPNGSTPSHIIWLRAHLDPHAACVPVRIERIVRDVDGVPSIDTSDELVVAMWEINDVVLRDGSIWYPGSVVEHYYEVDYSTFQPATETSKMSAEMCVTRKVTWRVSQLRTNAQIPDATFHVELPKDTYVFNKETGKVTTFEQGGSAIDRVLRQPPRELAVSAPPADSKDITVGQWLLLINLCFIGVGFAIAMWMRRRSA